MDVAAVLVARQVQEPVGVAGEVLALFATLQMMTLAVAVVEAAVAVMLETLETLEILVVTPAHLHLMLLAYVQVVLTQ
jgi:hypothetical protein